MGNKALCQSEPSSKKSSKKIYIRIKSYHKNNEYFNFKEFREFYSINHYVLSTSGFIICDSVGPQIFFSAKPVKINSSRRYQKLYFDFHETVFRDLNSTNTFRHRLFQLLESEIDIKIKKNEILKFGN